MLNLKKANTYFLGLQRYGSFAVYQKQIQIRH